uniref:hypothetical protein n=1 Tax=Dialister sp. TaxID=1955814 RepID=UPI004025CADE
MVSLVMMEILFGEIVRLARVRPWGVPALDCRRKRGSGFYRFRGVVRRIKTGKRRGVLKYMVFTKDEKPVNLLNLQNLFNL